MTIVDRYEPQLRKALESRVARAGGGPLSRWNLAKTLLTEHDAAMLSEIAKSYKLRVYFLSGVRPSGRDGRGRHRRGTESDAAER